MASIRWIPIVRGFGVGVGPVHVHSPSTNQSWARFTEKETGSERLVTLAKVGHLGTGEEDSNPGLLGTTLAASLESVAALPSLSPLCHLAVLPAWLRRGRALATGPGNDPNFLPFNTLGF